MLAVAGGVHKVIRSISLAASSFCIANIVLPIFWAMLVVTVITFPATALNNNKTVPASVVNDEPANKRATDGQIITGQYINEIVTEYLSLKGVQASPSINPARLFRKCDGSLTVNPMFGNFQTVRVECEDTIGWRVAVRTKIKLVTPEAKKSAHKAKRKTIPKITKKASRNVTTKSVKKAKTERVVSLTRSMTRGDIITPEDVAFVDVSMREVVGVFFDQDDVIGRRLKTSVSAKKPVFARQLHPYWMIEKDQEVTLVNLSGAVAVSMLGYALENGQFGEWIKVKNANSNKIVHGQVINSKKIATGTNIQ